MKQEKRGEETESGGEIEKVSTKPSLSARPGGGALPYMGYIGMCRCGGYGFQAVYSRIGYINQSVWV